MTDSTVRRVIYSVIGVLILCVMLFPVYWMVNASLQPSGNTLTAGFLPLHPTFSGYKRALDEQGGNLVTSMIIAAGTVVLSLAIATPCAYALSQFRSRWVSVGLLNSIPGLIVANCSSGIPFAILILRSFMMSLPPSLVEAARVDGAGLFRAFVAIVLPISKNSLITAGLFSFLFSWSDFLFALTLTTKGGVRPVTLGILSLIHI